MGILKTYSVASDVATGEVETDLLHKTISDGNVVENFDGVYLEGDDLKILGNSIINEPILDSIVYNHDAFGLESQKKTKIEAVDKRTVELISEGFNFGGKNFSLSIPAQSNLTNVMTNRDIFNSMGMFPISMSTTDNDLYGLSYENVIPFWGAGMTVVKTAYNGGGLLKKQIKDAVNKGELDAIIDNR